MSSDNTMPDNECHRCSAGKKEPVTRTCDEQKEVSSLSNILIYII
jgi:hypothetical protein